MASLIGCETNDGIVAADSIPLFDEMGQPRTFTMDLMAYDAGTEENNELAAYVPGPPYGGHERAPTTDVIKPHPGIRGDADVSMAFAWTEPIARLTVMPVAEEKPIVKYGYAVLNGQQETPVVETDAAGTAALGLDADGNLYFNLTVTGLSGPITAAHFHGPAPEGENAGVIFGITETFDGNHADGVWKDLTNEQMGYLMDGLLYLNVHTAANPAGEIRGQVHIGDNGIARLDGSAEVPPVDIDAAGTGAFKLMNGGTALWYSVTVTGLSGPITAAHFHGPAAEDENAGVIFGITETFKGNHAEGVWDMITPEQQQYLLDGMVYVNVHTAANPAGEIRGQVVGLQLPAEEPQDVFFMKLEPGLNMISLPLMPPEPYTAYSLAEKIGATIVIQFDTARQRFVGFTADSGVEGFAIEGGQGYIVNVPNGGSTTFVGKAWTNSPEYETAAPSADVRTTAWAFVLSGNVQNAEIGSAYTVVVKNLRTGDVATDVTSTQHHGNFAAVWADLNRKSVVEVGDGLEISLLDAHGNIAAGPFHHNIDINDIRKAYLNLPLLVGDVRPTETHLAQNFPNPFNPETWIPYQIAEAAEVTIQIYDVSGHIVRTLNLGAKPAGFYMTRGTAAYWDGRNNAGERVSSGVYFYTLQTKDFTATRKLLIAK